MGLVKYQWQLYRDIEKLPVPCCILAFITLLIRKAVGKLIK